MINVGDRVRDHEGLAGKVVRIVDCERQGDLLLIRLDTPDPLWGSLISAWEGEVEVLGEEGARA